MNKHFITEIDIEKIRHLKNITINLSSAEPRNLLLTGKNGSGKTTTLQAIKKNLESITQKDYVKAIEISRKDIAQLQAKLNSETDEDIINNIKNSIEENINKVNSWGIYGLDLKFNCDSSLLNPCICKEYLF